MKENSDLINDISLNEESKYIIPYKKFLNAYVPLWLVRRDDVSNGAKLLYGKLCQYAGKDGECFPKIKTLAKDLGCSSRTIERYMKELREYGLIEPIRLGKKCSNRYLFLRHEWMEFLVAPEEGAYSEEVDETEMAQQTMSKAAA